MSFVRLLPGAASLTVLLASPAAFAHVGFHPDGFAPVSFVGGLTHPFGGLDHLLAMVAVGLWAIQQGGRAIYAVPASFVAAMAAGFGLGISGIELGFAETGIALSVLALGLAVALALKPALPLAMIVTGLFALCHGFAHGAEMPEQGSALLYAAGMLIGTALLHGIGLAAAKTAQSRALPIATRAAGTAMAVAGLALLVL